MIKNKSGLIFFVLDIGLIILASFLAFALRFDGQIPQARLENLFVFTFLAVITTPAVFYLFDLYKLSWSYLSLTDLPIIIKGVGVATLFLGTLLYISRNHPLLMEFPRSIIFLYGILLFFLVSGLRFFKRIYWQLIRAKSGAPQPKKDQVSPISFKILDNNKPKNILVTGGAGYIGSVLIRKLLEKGYNVKVIDKLLFGSNSIKDLFDNLNFKFIQADILDSDFMSKSLFNIDAVVNLAAIVGEAACLSRKDSALKTNYLGSVYLARLCKSLGIKRFIQASTCSTYGQQDNNNVVPEPSRLFPVDFYGETKIYAEREIIKLMDDNFNPTILRFSTVYGLSPRMRFDLVVNTFTKKAVKDKEIFIFGGEQWRPLIHVDDVVNSIILALETSLSEVGNQIFNVGSNTENYLISQVGELVKECIPEVEIKILQGVEDKRSYKVDFAKIEKVLNFKNRKKVKDGIIEIRDAINSGRFPDLEDKTYYNHLV
jgi:nucleoside-diphosphate-sugar epimerase